MASTPTKQTKTAPKAPANQQPVEDVGAAAPPAKKRRSLLKMLLLGLLPAVAVAGAAAWYFLHDAEEAPAIKPGAGKPNPSAAASAKAVNHKPPAFLALEPFTVNLQHEDASPQYLQVGLSLKLTDAELSEKVKLYMPDIRNRVLLLLSGKRAGEISTPEGKKELSAELAREIVLSLAGSVPAQALDSVLFTSFVIQ